MNDLETTKEITLTNNELVAALSLSGYNDVASQILNDYSLVSGEAEFTRFVQETETTLKEKGYWDENRNSKLAKGLESLLSLLVHAKKKVRCVNMENYSVLLIHSINHTRVLLQRISNGKHAFYFHDKNNGLYDILRNHYNLTDSEASIEGAIPLQLSDQLVDEYHKSEPIVLETLSNDKAQPKPFRDFARHFLDNGQEFDNISLMISNYVKDESEFEEIQFLLPGDSYIWHMNYEALEKNSTIIMEPIPVWTYFKEIERVLNEFFSNK